MAEEKQWDRIHITDLLLRCIVGVFEEERHTKQDVNIQITLSADLSEACRSDDLRDTVDYKALKKKIMDLVENSSFFLVEALAENIARVCLEDPKVEEATVLLEKPGALRFARTVGVEITRRRETGSRA